MKITKVLNNNFALVGDKGEKIIMGLGIAYGKKAGDRVDEEKIMKVFRLSNPSLKNKMMELIEEVPLDVINTAEEIILNIKLEMGEKVNDIIYINIMDHINSALKRYQEGLVISNNLLPEIERFYPKEYSLGKMAVEIINKTFNVELTRDEIGFIALHIVNATMTESKDMYSYKITQIMKDVLNIVARYFKVQFDENSLYYHRFITHLRFFGQRIFTDSPDKSEDFEDLLKMIQDKYKKEYSCALIIKEYIGKNYKKLVTNEEILYLTIHIQRVIQENKK